MMFPMTNKIKLLTIRKKGQSCDKHNACTYHNPGHVTMEGVSNLCTHSIIPPCRIPRLKYQEYRPDQCFISVSILELMFTYGGIFLPRGTRQLS